MKIINVPIESLEERYSKQWNDNFPSVFKTLDLPVVTIYPEKESSKKNEIKRGQFLDYVDTNRFKALQLAEIYEMFDAGEVNDHDVFFFHDLWFPGIEGLFYVRDASKVKFKITGMIHAGTYDPNDYLTQCGMERWGKMLERSWFKGIDLIFVATNYHKQLLMKTRFITSPKIRVTGFPLWDIAAVTYSNVQKLNQVVFPHRFAPEKQPWEFDALEVMTRDKIPAFKFIKTKDVAQTKQQYYQVLERSKVAVSTALQETWGIAMQEAVLRRCLPLVPNRLSYREMYDPLFIYKNKQQAASKLVDFCFHYHDIVNSQVFQDNCKQLIESQSSAAGRMFDEIDRLVGISLA